MVAILAQVAKSIDWFNDKLGEKLSWLSFAMAILLFLVVLLRYGFNSGEIWLQELVVYLHAILFMSTAGYTLLHGEHVRVDLIYQNRKPKAKAAIDLAGSLLLLLPTCVILAYYSLPYVLDSWRIFEHSIESTGLPFVYILKTFILVFCVTLGLQSIALAIHSLLTLLDYEKVIDSKPNPIKPVL